MIRMMICTWKKIVIFLSKLPFSGDFRRGILTSKFPRYSEGHRLILLGSKNLWHLGPRLPVERAWEALRAGAWWEESAEKGLMSTKMSRVLMWLHPLRFVWWMQKRIRKHLVWGFWILVRYSQRVTFEVDIVFGIEELESTFFIWLVVELFGLGHLGWLFSWLL